MVANGVGFTPEPTLPAVEEVPTHSVSPDRARVEGGDTIGSVVLEVISGPVGDRGSYEISIPQLDGIWEADPLNVALRKPVLAEIARFGDGLVADDEAPAGEGFLTGRAVVHLLDDRLLSVAYDFESSSGGAARPVEAVRSVLLDLDTSSLVGIGDLFLSGSPWPETVAFLARQDLTARLGEGAVWGEGAGDRTGLGVDGENFRLFGVTASHLVLRFERYQVGPGALGAPEATIPWSSLVGLVDPDGPAGHLLP
jgi:hypothetical protein|tara:strand:- start:3908 stop:4669 length:762 start_codon:yes stop_codon:yes gene_type:complete